MGRGDLLLAPINLRMCWEEESECLHSLILCVCVCWKGRPNTCIHQYYVHVCRKGRPSACTHYYACVLCVCEGSGNRVCVWEGETGYLHSLIICICVAMGDLLLAPINSPYMFGNWTDTNYYCVWL